MADVTIDTSQNGGALATASSDSFDMTVAADANYILVCIGTRAAVDASRNVTAVTIEGVAASQIREDNNDTLDLTTEIWGLANPPTGANITIAVTFAGSIDRGAIMAISLKNVDTANPIDAQNGASGNGVNPSLSLSVTKIGAMLVAVTFNKNDAASTSATAPAAEAQEVDDSADVVSMITRGPMGATGATAIGWTAAVQDHAESAVALAPLTGTTLTPSVGSVPFASVAGGVDIRASNQIIVRPS